MTDPIARYYIVSLYDADVPQFNYGVVDSETGDIDLKLGGELARFEYRDQAEDYASLANSMTNKA